MKFAVAALLGLAAAGGERPVWGLRSVNDHRTDAQVQKAYGDASVAAANARDPLSSALVQLESDSSSDSDSDDDFIQTTDYLPGQSGANGLNYERQIPARFSGDSDDIFMRSVFNNYASEKADKDTGKPLGVFYITEASARALAEEVLSTHKNIRGAALQNYLNTYWSKAWGHFDVNRTGSIPPLYAPQLMRFLMSDQYISL